MYTSLTTLAEVCTVVAGFGARRSGLEEDHQTVNVPQIVFPGNFVCSFVSQSVAHGLDASVGALPGC